MCWGDELTWACPREAEGAGSAGPLAVTTLTSIFFFLSLLLPLPLGNNSINVGGARTLPLTNYDSGQVT